MSAPDTKAASPSPRIITTRVAWLAERECMVSARARHMLNFMAFKRLGFEMVTVAMPSGEWVVLIVPKITPRPVDEATQFQKRYSLMIQALHRYAHPSRAQDSQL